MKFIIKPKSQKYLTNILLILLEICKYLQKRESVTFTRNNLSEKEMALKRYINHPSINAITERKKTWNFTVSFNFISHEDTLKELDKIKSR